MTLPLRRPRRRRFPPSTFGAAVCVGLLLVVGWPGTGGASDPEVATIPEGATAATVERLVADLDADQRSVRRAAERSLLALGPAALAHLPPPELLPTVASREAVRRIRLVLERAQAEQSVRASTVALAGERTVREWLAEIERQTGNTFDVTALDPVVLDDVVSFDLTGESFWSVVDDHLRSLGIVPGDEGTGGTLRLVPADEDAPRPLRIAYVGGFRVSLDSLRRRPLFGDDAGDDVLRASLTVRAEPRLRPLFLTYAGSSLVVSEEAGGVRPPLDPDAKFDLPLGDGVGTPRFDLRIPKAEADVTVTLEGTLTATVAAGEEVIRFPAIDAAEDVARRRGGVTVRVTDTAFTRTGETARAEIGIAVTYDTGGPAFESHRAWVFHNRAHLERTGGGRVAFRPPAATTRQSNGAVAIRYTFDDLTGPPREHRFVYAAPTLIIDAPLSFAWKDLVVPPLPR